MVGRNNNTASTDFRKTIFNIAYEAKTESIDGLICKILHILIFFELLIHA